MKHAEHDLQVRCMTWARYNHPYLDSLFFAVPNGEHRSASVAARLKAEGVKRGVADIILLLPNACYSSLNIEMKDGSSQSEDQKLYELCVNASGGLYIVCRSYEEFTVTVTQYLATVDKNVIYRLKAIYEARRQAEKEKAQKRYQKLIDKLKK